MNNEFEQIVPWNGAQDTGRDVRLKLDRNFAKIKSNFEELAGSRYVTTDFFARLFAPEGEDGAEVDVNDMEAVITAVRVKFGLHTDSYISAKGNNPESGSTVAGASALVDLSDVDISNPQDGQIFTWDAARQKWVNADAPSAGLDEAALAEYLTTNHYAKTTDIPSLEDYATQTWASGQFALKTVAINAGTGLTGGGTLSASRTLSLATVGTAGTYTKVTVDAYGRVTGHASLAAGDIPALAISKITGLQAALDAKMNASQLSNLYRKRTDNAVTVSKALSALVAENDSEDAWNVPANTVLMLSNSNNALAFHLGGTMNERAANIQAGHNSSSYATALGTLYLNKLGGNVMVGEPSAVAKFNVEGGIYATSYLQVGGGRLMWDSANNALYVQKSDGSTCGFYATGFVSTKGANGDAGSVVEGASALSELEDVTISSPSNGQALVYRNGVWKNEAIETGLTSVSWDDVEGTPTTLAGYGITDAYTKTEADGRYVNVSGDTMTGGLSIKTYNYGDALNVIRNSNTSAGAISFSNNTGLLGIIGVGGSSMNEHQPIFSQSGSGEVYMIWHSGNDGSGSGLDADLLDGVHLSDIRNGNVYSATKLQTARTIWGQSFNGTANVSGDMTGVGNIIPSVDNSYYCGRWDRRWNFLYSMNYNIGSYGSNYLGGGNGDGASFSTYNVKLHLHYGLGITSNMDVCNIVIDGRTGNISTRGSVQIGSARLIYDSTNNALYVQKSDGSTCGFYATGFVSAKGANDDAIATARAVADHETRIRRLEQQLDKTPAPTP